MPNGSSSNFSGTVRVRACGLVRAADGLLMANHPGLYGHDFWLPPGGKVEFGNSIEDTIIREIREECNLNVRAEAFQFACSVRRGDIHAVEFFFRTEVIDGTLAVGRDPERGQNQILTDVRFISFREMEQMAASNLHPVFTLLAEPAKILDLTGFFELS